MSRLVAADSPSSLAPAEIVVGKVTEAASRAYGPSLRAVILTGSLARGEATFVRRADRWLARGDAEFFLVLQSGHRSPDSSQLEAEVQGALLREGVSCTVDLAATNDGYLRALRPNIFTYELRTCGRIVWGDADVLKLVRPFGPEEIPLEDGWRLLSNRMVEMLEWPTPLPRPGDPLPEDIAYRALKLCLDTATSLLLFRGSYSPSYRVRAERLSRLESGEETGASFPLHQFQSAVEDLTRVKLEGLSKLPDWEQWRDIVTWALLLWEDQLSHLLGSARLEPGAAMGRFARGQPLKEKVRGWLAVWRTAGMIEGTRMLPTMAQRLFAGSPRYQVYGIAADLLRELPALVLVSPEADSEDSRWRDLRHTLPSPAPARASADRPQWQQLADDVVRHYRRFLVKTRS